LLAVGTNVGGVPEIIQDGENGFLVESKNSKALAKKMDEVLNLDEKEIEKIKKEARKTIEEKFSLERMVKDYENLYFELLNLK